MIDLNTRFTVPLFLLLPLGILALGGVDARPEVPPTTQPAGARPQIVAHRGLLRHAPENTLAAFAACLDLRLGFELDVRRTKDGQLVCVHDEDVKRTTDGTGKVADLTLAALRKLDAGRWFDPAFTGQMVPTLEEVFALLSGRKAREILVALDLKVEGVEEETVRLAEKYGVLDQVVCIGLAISEPAVRKKLRAANPKTPVAILADKSEDLPQALEAADADWLYIRFVPSAEQIGRIRAARKRVFLVGKTVSGLEPANWLRAREAGVDAVLTDYPLDCRLTFRSGKLR